MKKSQDANASESLVVDIKKVQNTRFDNPKIQKEIEKIERDNRDMLEASKVDTSGLKITFEI